MEQTSPAHTSVKIDPEYSGAVVYVKDASRSVGVAQRLMNDLEGYTKELDEAHNNKREAFASKTKTPLRSFEDAKCLNLKLICRLKLKLQKIGEVLLEPSLEELHDFIDWMPYFNAWEFSGRFPDILNDPAKGKEAKKL